MRRAGVRVGRGAVGGTETLELRTLLSGTTAQTATESSEVRLLVRVDSQDFDYVFDASQFFQATTESSTIPHRLGTELEWGGRQARWVVAFSSFKDTSIVVPGTVFEFTDRHSRLNRLATYVEADSLAASPEQVLPPVEPMGPFQLDQDEASQSPPSTTEAPTREVAKAGSVDIEVEVELSDPGGALTATDLHEIEIRVQRLLQAITGYSPQHAKLTLQFRHIREAKDRPEPKQPKPAPAIARMQAATTVDAAPESRQAQPLAINTEALNQPTEPQELPKRTTRRTKVQPAKARPRPTHVVTPRHEADFIFATGEMSFLDQHKPATESDIDKAMLRSAQDTRTDAAAAESRRLPRETSDRSATSLDAVTEASKPEATIVLPDKIGSREDDSSTLIWLATVRVTEAAAQTQSQQLPPETPESSTSLIYLEHLQAPRGPPTDQTIGSAFRLNRVGRLRLQLLRHNVAPRSPSVVLAP